MNGVSNLTTRNKVDLFLFFSLFLCLACEIKRCLGRSLAHICQQLSVSNPLSESLCQQPCQQPSISGVALNEHYYPSRYSGVEIESMVKCVHA